MSKPRLIDANELIKDRVCNDPVRIAAECAPTIDAVPVVHGRWIGHFEDDSMARVGCYACSQCRAQRNYLEKADCNYCPNCGALMQED